MYVFPFHFSSGRFPSFSLLRQSAVTRGMPRQTRTRLLAGGRRLLLLSVAAVAMSFRSIRDHSHMRFADSYTQDMDFWRQRVGKEEGRMSTPSAFAGDTLRDLPRNPFKDSAGMLLGTGVSPRNMNTSLGALSPNLASFRAATSSRTVQPSTWHLSAASPYHLRNAGSISPEDRAMKGALRLLPPPSTAPPFRPVKQYEKVCPLSTCETRGHTHTRIASAVRPPVSCAPRAPSPCPPTQHLIIEAPDQRICASLRRGMPRSRLDARMYAATPG